MAQKGGARGQTLAKAALAKASNIEQGTTSVFDPRVSPLSQSLGVTYDSNYNITGNNTNDRLDAIESDYVTEAPSDGNTYGRLNGNWTQVISGVNDHTLLTNIGTNTHAQIDAHIADDTKHSRQLATAHSTAVTSVANTNFLLDWDTVTRTDSNFTITGTDITCNFTGDVEIDATATVDTNNRSEVILEVLKNTVAETTSYTANYATRDADQNTGSTNMRYIVSVTTGDILTVRVTGDTDGTCVLRDGTRLIVEAL